MATPMSAFDAGWMVAEKMGSPGHFGPLLILTPPSGGPPGFVRDLVEAWRRQRSFAPPFNFTLGGLAPPMWKTVPDGDIDLDYHFRHSALPAPGGERELGILVSRLHSNPLDQRRPLWECHVIEGLEGGRFAIYLKLHHAQLDGMGTARLFDQVMARDPTLRDMPPPWTIGMKAGRPRPKQGGKPTGILARLQGLAGALPSVARAAAQVVRAAVRPDDEHSPAPYRAPRSLLNRRIGGQRRYATQYFKLDALRQIAKAADATVNEVFLTACGGALRRYLRENKALPKRSLVAQVPVNLRDEAGIDTIGNAIGFIYVNIHTDIADTAARLAAVRKSCALAKQQYAGIKREGINLFTMLLLAPYMLQTFLGLGGRLPAAANLVISNVAGPREHRYLNGARINQMFGPSVIFDGQALNITLMSYADEANIGFTGCRTTLPRMQNVAVYLGEELRALREAFGLNA